MKWLAQGHTQCLLRGLNQEPLDHVAPYIVVVVIHAQLAIVLPAKSDSYVMFYLQSYQGLRIVGSLVY